jgi:hypothetical protein
MPDDGQVPPRGPSGGPPQPGSTPPPPSPNPPPPSPYPPPASSPPPASFPPPRSAGMTTDLRLGGRQLPIRPMSVGDVLDGAFSGLRATFVPVAILVALVLGPIQLALNLALSRLSPRFAGGGVFSGFGEFDDALALAEPAVVGVSLLFSVISLLVTLIASAAAVELLLQVDRGEPTDVGRSLRGALSVFWVLLGASVLLALGGLAASTVFVLLGMLVGLTIPVVGPILVVVLFLPVFVIVGAAVIGAYGMLVPIAIIERRGPIATIARSLWVVRRRFWRLVGITLLLGLLAALATVGLQLPFALLSVIAGPFAWLVTTIGEVLGQIVVVPITAFGALLVYLDARVRHEGLDLQLRSREVGGA